MAENDDIVFEVRMDRRTFDNLRRSAQVRSMVGEGSNLIDAFALRFIKSVEAGLPSYYFKQKREVD